MCGKWDDKPKKNNKSFASKRTKPGYRNPMPRSLKEKVNNKQKNPQNTSSKPHYIRTKNESPKTSSLPQYSSSHRSSNPKVNNHKPRNDEEAIKRLNSQLPSKKSRKKVNTQELRDGIEAYKKFRYEAAIDHLRSFIRQGGVSKERKIFAYQFLGASYYLLNEEIKAKSVFYQIIRLNPHVQIDTTIFMPGIVDLFNQLKSK